MTRKDELLKIIGDNPLYYPLVDNIVKLETKLTEVESLPFYKVNPNNPEQQKVLPAFKVYKELLQQYTNCLKCLGRLIGVDDNEEDSPLRAWARMRLGGE